MSRKLKENDVHIVSKRYGFPLFWHGFGHTFGGKLGTEQCPDEINVACMSDFFSTER